MLVVPLGIGTNFIGFWHAERRHDWKELVIRETITADRALGPQFGIDGSSRPMAPDMVDVSNINNTFYFYQIHSVPRQTMKEECAVVNW